MAYILEEQSEAGFSGIQQLEELRDLSGGKDREVIDCVLLFADMVSKKRLIHFIANAIEEIEDSNIYTRLLQIAAYWNEDDRPTLTEQI